MRVGMARLGGKGTGYFSPHRVHALLWVFDVKGDDWIVDLMGGVLPVVVQVLGLCITNVVTTSIERVRSVKKDQAGSISKV